MFTGLIEAVANVKKNEGGKLMLERPKIFRDIKLGSSIAVSGVCLTVSKLERSSMTFDVVPTTRKKSTLGTLKKGSTVNLERAMKASDRFEGHVVMGHSEGVGVIASFVKKLLTVKVPKDFAQSIVRHGSITIDGVSLTVAEHKGNSVTVALVPHTLKHTTLGILKKGDRVNLETDILAKYHQSVPF